MTAPSHATEDEESDCRSVQVYSMQQTITMIDKKLTRVGIN